MSKCHKYQEINRSHEKYIGIIYNDKQSSISELLERDGSVSFHRKNIQSLAIEMFRVSRNISPPIMNDISPPIMNDSFKQKSNSRYNHRQISRFSRPLVKPV